MKLELWEQTFTRLDLLLSFFEAFLFFVVFFLVPRLDEELAAFFFVIVLVLRLTPGFRVFLVTLRLTGLRCTVLVSPLWESIPEDVEGWTQKNNCLEHVPTYLIHNKNTSCFINRKLKNNTWAARASSCLRRTAPRIWLKMRWTCCVLGTIRLRRRVGGAPNARASFNSSSMLKSTCKNSLEIKTRFCLWCDHLSQYYKMVYKRKKKW